MAGLLPEDISEQHLVGKEDKESNQGYRQNQALVLRKKNKEWIPVSQEWQEEAEQQDGQNACYNNNFYGKFGKDLPYGNMTLNFSDQAVGKARRQPEIRLTPQRFTDQRFDLILFFPICVHGGKIKKLIRIK